MGSSLQPPDDKRLFMLLRVMGLNAEQAYTFVQELRTMAAENIIARFESKLDALTSKFNLLLWFIGIGVALIIATSGVFVSTLLN